MRFDVSGGKVELPVKLRYYNSVFVPLAKWAMLMAGNYRCITEDGMRTAREAVHSDLEASRTIYDFVLDVCAKIGASHDGRVPRSSRQQRAFACLSVVELEPLRAQDAFAFFCTRGYSRAKSGFKFDNGCVIEGQDCPK